MNVCTIIASNYVAYARVLARSLTEADPGSHLWTLVIDDFSARIDPAQEPFELLTPADIACEDFTHMAVRYSVLELSTAVKPWLLRHLMAQTGEPVTYLDPDIKIYGSMTMLDELAAEHGVVLIPHNSKPIPQDGRSPSQVDVMIAGIYNLGYVSLAPRPEVDRLLDWWADRLRQDCRVDPVWGYFVDQRWFDLAPGFLEDFAIVRDPEYNLAYWNLHERRLEFDGGRYLVDGRPLSFFHFSGFDAQHPLVLSKYQDRIDVLADPVLERLLAGYASDVLQAGHAESRAWPYSFERLGDGTLLADRLRDLWDDYTAEHPEGVGSPFELSGARDFTRWLRTQAPGAPAGINRVLNHLYETVPELHAAFRGRGGPDRDALLRWATEHGSREEPLLAEPIVGSESDEPAPVRETSVRERAKRALGPARALGPVVVPAGPDRRVAPNSQPRPLHREPWGVNAVGYFRSELGTGEAARQMVSALDCAAVPVLPIHGQTIPLSRQEHPYETAAPDDAPFPVNLICMNADMLPEFVREVGNEFFAERYSIGLWFWEVSRFPERWHESFSLLEELWAPTAHVADALRPLSSIPVNVVRIPVVPTIGEPRSRAGLGIDEHKFVFLFSFDYLSVAERKNPIATVRAFERAFAPGEGAALIVKCINSEHDADYHARLRAQAATHADITIIDRYLSPADNSGLTAVCDAYVSLHRAEGFGLGMAEAMWHGKPVIATGYSGNLDFMNESNSLLVDYGLVEIGPGADPYPADGVWAEPDVEHAATLMRGLYDDRDRARKLGETAAHEIRRTHSPQAAAMIVLRRLESIRATGQVRPALGAPRLRSPSLAALPLAIRQGPANESTPERSVRGVVRKATLRVIRPFTAYQQSVNAQVTSAMEELSDGLGEARRDVAVETARILTELRNAAADLQALPALVAEQQRRIEALERELRERHDLETFHS